MNFVKIAYSVLATMTTVAIIFVVVAAKWMS